MIKFEFNGKPFDPRTFEEQILRAAMNQMAEEMHRRVSAIRHPVTGEFPTVVVNGTSLEDMSMRIEWSPELLALVNERLGTGSWVTYYPLSCYRLDNLGRESKLINPTIGHGYV